MKVNQTRNEIEREFAELNAKLDAMIRQEEADKEAARKAHLAKPYKRSEDAKPFSWDA
jgi:hypothetical protein